MVKLREGPFQLRVAELYVLDEVTVLNVTFCRHWTLTDSQLYVPISDVTASFEDFDSNPGWTQSFKRSRPFMPGKNLFHRSRYQRSELKFFDVAHDSSTTWKSHRHIR